MTKIIVGGSTGINARAISIQYFFCDLFYFLEGTGIASYTEDTTPYNTNFTKELVINRLEITSLILF